MTKIIINNTEIKEAMTKLIIDGKEIKEPRKLRLRIKQLIALKPRMTAELYNEVYQLVINTWMDGVNAGYLERHKEQRT